MKNVNNLKNPDAWKTQLIIANKFNSYIDSDEERIMHLKNDSIKITVSHEVDEVVKNLFDYLKNRYPNNFQSMKGSEIVFHYIYLMYYKCHKINPNRGGSYVNYPDWIKNKKSIINPINKKDKKCF